MVVMAVKLKTFNNLKIKCGLISMVCTLIENHSCHHSGQNVVNSQSAAEPEPTAIQNQKYVNFQSAS